MKKLLSLLLCVSLLCALSAPAFAASSVEKNEAIAKENDANTDIRIEEINDSLLFIYTDDKLVFCSQIDIDGNVSFAYVGKAQKQMYESGVMRLDEVIDDIDLNNISKKVISESIASWSGAIMDRLSEFEVVHSMDCSTILDVSETREQVDSRASTPISTELNKTFGPDYIGSFVGLSSKSYDGVDYTVYCHGNQSTYQLKYAPYEFFAGQTLVAIAAWIATGGFSFSLQWFLSAAGALTSTFGAGEALAQAISGNLYVYECDRTRIVTVPAYTSTVQYWAGWTLKSTFLDNGSTWNVSTYHNIKHSDYDDISGLIQTGFNNFVAYTLQ